MLKCFVSGWNSSVYQIERYSLKVKKKDESLTHISLEDRILRQQQTVSEKVPAIKWYSSINSILCNPCFLGSRVSGVYLDELFSHRKNPQTNLVFNLDIFKTGIIVTTLLNCFPLVKPFAWLFLCSVFVTLRLAFSYIFTGLRMNCIR